MIGAKLARFEREAKLLAWLNLPNIAHVYGFDWMGRAWNTTAKNVFDALLYALVTAGTFGWLWP